MTANKVLHIQSNVTIVKEEHEFEEDLSQYKAEPDCTSVAAPMKPTHIEFLESLKALDVLRQYASVTHGPDMERLNTLALEMQAIGYRHVANGLHMAQDKS